MGWHRHVGSWGGAHVHPPSIRMRVKQRQSLGPVKMNSSNKITKQIALKFEATTFGFEATNNREFKKQRDHYGWRKRGDDEHQKWIYLRLVTCVAAPHGAPLGTSNYPSLERLNRGSMDTQRSS